MWTSKEINEHEPEDGNPAGQMIDDRTRKAIAEYIGMEEIRELSVQVDAIAGRIELSAGDREAHEEEALDRRAQALVAEALLLYTDVQFHPTRIALGLTETRWDDPGDCGRARGVM